MPFVRLRSSSTIALALSSDSGSERNEDLALDSHLGQLSCDSDDRVVRDRVGRCLDEIRRADGGLARLARRHPATTDRRGSQTPTIVIARTFVDSARRSADARSNALLVASRYASPCRWSGSR